MESRGIIRKSNSAWGSRVVLVTKKDGSVRFCVDYRDLNSKLKLQDSPIPLCVEAIDRLASGKGPMSSLFLSTLDLASGFWCLPIKDTKSTTELPDASMAPPTRWSTCTRAPIESQKS